ncbi:MAG: hypothetical protein A4E66_02533 [Syntrophus sp. PtaB.Bin001]|nr:MAG: hypothetical protein A4E66_02533 [Syntrophus sp. PtaB.Bin001]
MITAVQLGEHAFESPVIEKAASAAIYVKSDLLTAGTVKENVPDIRRELPKRGVDIEAVMLGQGLHHLVILHGIAARPGDDGAFTDGQVRIGDYEIFIEIHPRSQTAAIRAGPVRTVKGEKTGCQFRQADPADRAGVFFTEE